MKKIINFLALGLLLSLSNVSLGETLDPNILIPVNQWEKATPSQKHQICKTWLDFSYIEMPELIPRSYANPLEDKDIQDCVNLLDRGVGEIQHLSEPPEELQYVQNIFIYIYSRVAEFSRP